MTQPSIRLDSTIVPPSTTFNISYMDATVMDATAMDATAIDATAIDATTIHATTIHATAIETTAIETPTMNTPTIENKLKTSNNMPNSKAMGKRNPRRRNKPFCYDRLTVGDAKKEDLVIVKKHGTFRQTLLILNRPNKRYNVESAVIDGVTYFRSLEHYESTEFEQIFGFTGRCEDFVKGKIVVVRASSC